MKSLNVNNSKEFLLEFFKNSKINDLNGALTIDNVPNNFENFIGKKAPYKFVFDINSHNKVKDSELIMQGSYFLLAIRDYLRDKGETSLLKIDIKPDLLSLNKKLKKYKILKIKYGETKIIYEFCFLSNYQYLNDKKQSINKFLIKDNNILELDINRFNKVAGNKEEIKSLDPTQEYNVARKFLDKKINQDTKNVKSSLKVKLKKELLRIKDHYLKQIKEKDEEVENCANKIKMLNSKLRHTSYERDRNIIQRIIRESQARLEMLKKRSYKERLLIEEEFHIKDEVEKHVLSINSSLINVTVFYYPIFNIQVSQDSRNIIKYDPILDKIIK
jgi:hypothetical protein